MTERVYNVLFLCTGNSARSILGEAIIDRLGQGRFKGWSAGSMPKGKVNPHALALLDKLGHPTAHLRSKPWDEFARAENPEAPELDFIFTVCDNAAGEVCPIWPGQPMTAHWGIPDPAAAPPAEIAQAFETAYAQLTDRIQAFIALPLADLDQASVRQRLKAIGAMPGATRP